MSVDLFVQSKLKRLREDAGLTLEKLANQLDTTPITLSRYETGKRSVSLCILEEICAVYGLTINGFFSDKDGNSVLPEGLSAKDVQTNERSLVNIYGSIAAGSLSTAVEEIFDAVEIPEAISQRFSEQNLFGLAINGQSMNKIVADQNYVILNKQESANNGDIVAVLVNDEDATIKRFYQLDNETVILKPESYDETFTPITIDLRNDDQSFKILGKMVWHCAPYHV